MKNGVLALLLLLSVFATAQNTVPPGWTNGLEAQLEKVRKDFYAPGFAVAVVNKDGIVWSKGFGYRDVEKKLPATPNTVYAIGSCTKAFTSGLIGLLQKEGKVELDKPARDYLPSLRFYNDAMYDRISLRDMMSHRTGLPRHDFSWYFFSSASTDSLMQRVAYQEPTAGVRDRWQYNNFMFGAQGAIAEKLTGKTWHQAIRENFFTPLGMKNSNTTLEEWMKGTEPAVGYGLRSDSIIKKLDYYNISGMAAAGAINSSVTDMAPWVVSWINGGTYKGKTILPTSYVTSAMSSQAIIGAGLPTKEKPDVMFSNYGFGWFLASYRGHYRVEHGGNIDGFSASTSFFPTDSVGIIVLVNQNGSPVPSVVRNIISDRLLGLKPFDWAADALKTQKQAQALAKINRAGAAAPKKGTSPSHALADFEGDYKHPGYGSFTVYRRADSLFINAGGHRMWLRHRHYDVFDPYTIDKETGEIDTADATSPIKFQFHTGVGGDIEYLTVPFEAELKPLQFIKQFRAVPVATNELKKYEGDYNLNGATIKVYIKDGKTLYAVVPGQPEYELVPVGQHKFGLKNVPNYFVQFTVDGSTAKDLTFIQPNGNFKAVRK